MEPHLGSSRGALVYSYPLDIFTRHVSIIRKAKQLMHFVSTGRPREVRVRPAKKPGLEPTSPSMAAKLWIPATRAPVPKVAVAISLPKCMPQVDVWFPAGPFEQVFCGEGGKGSR